MAQQTSQTSSHPSSSALAAFHRLPLAVSSRAALLAGLTLTLLLAGAAQAFAITRDTVLARAQTWIDSPVPYSQTSYYAGYRTDCSGYASMCWATGGSWNTRTFYQVTYPILQEQLKPGDALLKPGSHIRMFYGWVDVAHTMYVTYEQTGPWTRSSIKSIAVDLANGYKPTRYDYIQDSPAPDNVLMNGTFNTWAAGDPVWWNLYGASVDATTAVQRNDFYRSRRFSVELNNTSGRATTSVSMEQTATVVPGTPYTLSAWASMEATPALLQMRLRYTDAAGASILETRTTAAAWGVGPGAFSEMRLRVAAPAGAAFARVSFHLYGGVDASGTPDVSAVLDEITMLPPRATIGIRSTAYSTYTGRTPVLSGAVMPLGAIGRNAVVYVKKPGRSYYSYSSARTVYAVTGGAAWQYKYYFKPGMAKGVYYFKAAMPPWTGVLGGTSGVIAIRLR